MRIEPLEVGKIYKHSPFGSPRYFQVISRYVMFNEYHYTYWTLGNKYIVATAGIELMLSAEPV